MRIDQKTAPRLYAFNNGFMNAAWLTGWARDVTKDGMLLQQTNNLNLALPISFTEMTKVPSRVKDRAMVHVIARLEGVARDNGEGKLERIIRVRPLAFEVPSLMNLPPAHAWNLIVPPGAPTDEFKPVQGPSGKLTANSNVVKVAGFISSFFLVGDKADPTLILLLLQNGDESKGLPVRIYGSQARPLAARLKRGMPVFIEGRYQVKIEVIAGGEAVDGIVPVRKMPYIHASTIRQATAEDIQVLPNWAEIMMNEARGVVNPKPMAQPKPDQAAIEEIAHSRVNELPLAEAEHTPAVAANSVSDLDSL